MTALERIEGIKKQYPERKPSGLEFGWISDNDFEFLLQSFEVMRRIAISCIGDDGCSGVRPLKHCENDIDKEFEKRMKEK